MSELPPHDAAPHTPADGAQSPALMRQLEIQRAINERFRRCGNGLGSQALLAAVVAYLTRTGA